MSVSVTQVTNAVSVTTTTNAVSITTAANAVSVVGSAGSSYTDSFTEASFYNSLWVNYYTPTIIPAHANVAGDVCIFLDGETYRAYYNDGAIYQRTSSDGITWGDEAAQGVSGTLVCVVKKDSTYHLWVNAGEDAIKYYTSDTGDAPWTAQNSGNAVITPTEDYELEGEGSTRNPWARWDAANNQWEMLYGCSTIVSVGNNANREPKYMARATSPDGITWTKHGVILEPTGTAGNWRELGALLFPAAYGSPVWMGIGSGLVANNTYVGLLTNSAAGWDAAWVEATTNPIITPSNFTGYWKETYTINHIYAPRYIQIGGQDRIYFNAGIYGLEKIGHCYRLPVDRTAWFAQQYVNGADYSIVAGGLQMTGRGPAETTSTTFAYLECLRPVSVGETVRVTGKATASTNVGDVPLRLGIGDRVAASTLAPNANKNEWFIYYNEQTNIWRVQKRVNNTFGTEQTIYNAAITLDQNYTMEIKRTSDGAILKLFDQNGAQLGSTITYSGDTVSSLTLYPRLGNRGLATGVYRSIQFV